MTKMTPEQIYARKQEFIGFLKTIKSDVDYTIKRANGTWTVSAIAAADELLDALRHYEDEITFYRDSLQEQLDRMTFQDYDDVEEEVA